MLACSMVGVVVMGVKWRGKWPCCPLKGSLMRLLSIDSYRLAKSSFWTTSWCKWLKNFHRRMWWIMSIIYEYLCCFATPRVSKSWPPGSDSGKSACSRVTWRLACSQRRSLHKQSQTSLIPQKSNQGVKKISWLACRVVILASRHCGRCWRRLLSQLMHPCWDLGHSVRLSHFAKSSRTRSIRYCRSVIIQLSNR